jgi:hypothetical protein
LFNKLKITRLLIHVHQTECGIAYRQPNARIVGGVEAVEHSWPSAVLIIATYKADIYLGDTFLVVDISFMCGGTLIDRKNVIYTFLYLIIITKK